MNFSQTLASMTGSDPLWQAQVDDSWLQGRSQFGGLQAALAVQAMQRQLSATQAEMPLRVLQVTFIAPLGAGPQPIATRVLRQSKNSIHMQADLLTAQGQIGCHVIGIFGRERDSSIHCALPGPTLTKSAEQTRIIPYTPDKWPAFAQHVEFRWASGSAPFSGQAEGHTQIYVRLLDAARMDTAKVVALADAIPSPGLSMLTRPVASSSLTWTLELLTDDYDPDPAKPWLMDATICAGSGGYLNQSATLFDPSGKAVALARQCVVVFG